MFLLIPIHTPAVRTAVDYIIAAGDSWFANTPRRGGVLRPRHERAPGNVALRRLPRQPLLTARPGLRRALTAILSSQRES